MWKVKFTEEARGEFASIPSRERLALVEAMRKLEALGDQLGAPNSSAVKGVAGYLRELRPRRGSSSWRALYRRIGNEMVIGAFSPEALTDRRGFERSVRQALTRLNEYVPKGD